MNLEPINPPDLTPPPSRNEVLLSEILKELRRIWGKLDCIEGYLKRAEQAESDKSAENGSP